MAGKPVGTMVVELDLDTTRYIGSQQRLLKDATQTSLNIEQNFKNLGIKSAAEFDLMRQKIQNSYDMISNSSKATKDDILRAEKAHADKMKAIDNQQYGERKSLLESFKTHYVAVIGAIYAAYQTISKAWNLAESAASFNEQMQLLDGLAQKYGTSSTSIVNSIKEVSEGMISMQTAAHTATSAMAKGLSPEMLINLSKAAVTLSDVMGTTADDAFQRLGAAMETGKEKSIKLAIGVIDLKDKYGDQADKMTEVQKQTALYNLIMEKTEEIQRRTGGGTKSLSDEMETLKITLKDLELTMGQGLIRAGAAIVGVFNLMAGAALGALGGLYKMKEWVAEFFGNTEKASKAAADAAAAFGARDELFQKAESNFKLVTASTEELNKATVKASASVDQHRVSEGERQKIAAETAKALDALSKVVQKYGEEQLKIGKDVFTEKLKEENATIATLSAGMEAYLATLKEVFDARIAGEKAISEAMAKSGAKPKELLEAQVAVLKAEKEHLMQRFAGWMDYYQALRNLHSKAVDAQKAKEKELAALQAQIAQQRMGHETLVAGLVEKLMLLQGKAQTDESIYMVKREALQREWGMALALTGEAQVKALNDVMGKFAALTGEVTTQTRSIDFYTGKWVDGTKTIITGEESIQQALNTVDTIQKQIILTQEAMTAAKQAEIDKDKLWAAELESGMKMAQAEMAKYKVFIDEASKAIEKMDREVAINVIDNASPVIRQIKNELDALQNKVVTVTVNQTAGTTVSGGGGESFFAPYAPISEGVGSQGWRGGDYPMADGAALSHGKILAFARGGIVNRPTLFPMAHGTGLMGEAGPEAVMPLRRGSDGRLGVSGGGGQVINFSPSINISGSDKSPEQLAREIVRPLREEMRRLTAVGV